MLVLVKRAQFFDNPAIGKAMTDLVVSNARIRAL